MKLNESYFEELEQSMNKNKKWFNKKVEFGKRDKILIKIGYRKAMRDILEEVSEDIK